MHIDGSCGVKACWQSAGFRAVWPGLQLDYDMALAIKHAERINVRRVSQPAAGGHRAPH